MKLNILVIGSGGREHAFVKCLKKSSNVAKIYAMPGNAGINQDAIEVKIDSLNFPEVVKFCKNSAIDLVVVGPEVPLVAGITDALEANNINVFGPSKAASVLEGSKDFMKEVVSKYGIPTAEYKTFTNSAQAKIYVHTKGTPIVIKTDGLAAGKGVTVALNQEEANKAIDEAFAGKFGDAGKKIIIEEFLEGEEASFFVISDGRSFFEFGTAQDHKRAFDNDEGPNTGGMGTYSPASIVSDMVRERVMKHIIQPTIDGLAKDGTPYKGFLFAGLMIDKNGNPKLLEYNIRMGDPETQAILPRLESDLAVILLKASQRKLNEIKEIKFSRNYALCVVMAAQGYPEEYKKHLPIDLSATTNLTNATVFHAGTIIAFGNLVSSGGRVLGVTGVGSNIHEAQKNAYSAVAKINFEGGFYRKDIGYREIARG